jgi:hypothetical protein
VLLPYLLLDDDPTVVDALPPAISKRFDVGGMVVPILPPVPFFEASFPDLIPSVPFIPLEEFPPFVRRPKPPPRPKRGGPAGGGGGGGWLRDECPPGYVYDPIRDRCVPMPSPPVFEELGKIPMQTPPAVARSTAKPRMVYQVAKLLGPGWAGFVATKVAGKLATDRLGKHAGTVANLGAFWASVKATDWKRLQPYQGQIVTGSAIGALDDVFQRYVEPKPGQRTYRRTQTADKLVTTARTLGVPIEAKAVPHRMDDGRAVLVIRYLVDLGPIVLYWQEAREILFGEVDLSGTLLEDLRRMR